MKRVIISLRDKVIEQFMVPQFVPNQATFVRSLQDEIRRGGEQNVLANHAKDFQAFEFGVFDDDTGAFVCHEAPKFLFEVMTLVEAS